ncbi:ABC transporter permease [Planctomycetota bacterium]
MYKLLMICRYFLKKRVALIAVAAVSLVVMLVLVVLSVMSGLVEDIKNRNHDWMGDVVISSDSMVGFGYYEEFMAELRQNEQVEAAAAVIKTFGLLSGPEDELVQLYGVKPGPWGAVTNFRAGLHYQKGSSEISFTTPPNDLLTAEQRQRGCITGMYLTLRRYTSEHSKRNLPMLRSRGLSPQKFLEWPVTVMGLTERGTPIGSGLGERSIFRYIDDSDTGLVDIDMSAMYVDFDQLQQICFMDGGDDAPPRTNEIRIRLAENDDLEQGRTGIAAAWEKFVARKADSRGANLLAQTTVQSWKQYRRSSIAPMEKEKSLMIAVFAMIAVVAVFIVFAIFYMIVTEKIKDLGIIKSVGGSNWSVEQIFLGYGLLVGIIGAIIGTTLGCVIVWNSNEIESGVNSILTWLNKVFENWDWQYRFGGFHLWDPEVYAIERIPDVVDFTEAAIIALIAVLASVTGAMLPARRAGRLQVVETLRVE